MEKMATAAEIIGVLERGIYQLYGKENFVALWQNMLEVIPKTTEPKELEYLRKTFIEGYPHQWLYLDELYEGEKYIHLIRKAIFLQIIVMAQKYDDLTIISYSVVVFNDPEVNEAMAKKRAEL